MLLTALKRFGVRKIETVGAAFDPSLHDAILEQDPSSERPGTIIGVMEDGYMIEDRLLRPARVIVAGRNSDRATQSDAAVATDVTLATTVAATKPATSKSTLLKAPAVAPAGAAPSTDSAATPGTADPSTTAISTGTAHTDVAPQPASAGKEKAENGIADAAKADGAAGSSSTPEAAAAAHQPSAIPEAATRDQRYSDVASPTR